MTISKLLNVDRLSSLPELVRQKILDCLPLEDVVRTSVLSTHWRHEWTKLSQIILDKQFFSNFIDEEEIDKDSDAFLTKYIDIVNNVLLCHVGDLRKLELLISIEIIGEWLEILSEKRVNELTLECNGITKLPSTVFSCTNLTDLTLIGFEISTFPPSFCGFPCLISLKLTPCDFKSGNAMERVIRSCPQLLFLHIYYSDSGEEFLDLTIHAAKLEHLIVEGGFDKYSLHLGNETTQIKTLEINFPAIATNILLTRPLPGLQTLRLGYFFLNNNHWRLSDLALGRLETRTLELFGVALHKPVMNYFVVNLLNISRLLQRLYCVISEHGPFIDRNPPAGSNCPNIELGNLPCLKYVDIVYASLSSVELQFIKSILGCAPVLEVLTVELSDGVIEDSDKLETAMSLMQHPRASTNAQIIFKA